MVKAGAKWVTAEEFEKLKALAAQTSSKVAPDDLGWPTERGFD